MRILLVDDHNELREALGLLLQSHPSIEVVAQCANLYETLQFSQFVDLDLILMDFSLPDGSAVEVASQLTGQHPGLQVAFLTASPRQVQLALEGSPLECRVLSKFSPPQVLIEQVLSYRS